MTGTLRRDRRPVVVGFTDVPAGTAALRLALLEARDRRTTVSLIHGATGVERAARYGADDRDDGPRRRSLLDILSRVNKLSSPQDQIEVRVVTTPVEDELVLASKSAQLVVVGVTTKHAVAAAAFDTVPRHVVQHAACPVLVVPAGVSSDAPRTIVCGVDRSVSSAAALRWAATEAARYGVMLHAVELEGARGSNAAAEPLSQWVAKQRPEGATTILCHTERSRHPAQALLDAAASREGFLAVGRSERPTPAGWRSVVAQVTAQTMVPTFVVPRAERALHPATHAVPASCAIVDDACGDLELVR